MLLLAEETLLLLTDPVTGRPRTSGERVGLAAAGAVLVELVLSGHLDIAGKGHPLAAPGRVVVRPVPATGDPVLDESLHRLALDARPRKPQDVLPRLAKGLREALHHRLAASGVLRAEPVRALGVTWTTRWPAVDPAGPSAALRTRVRDVVVGSRAPDARDATLVAVVHAVGRVPDVVGDVGLARGEVRRRAAAVADGQVGGEAVRRAVAAAEAVTAAVAAATAAWVVATTSSG